MSSRIVAVIIVLVLPLLGCGKGGLERQDLYGMVTFQDKPVPSGRIMFRPDRSRGGTGPAGFSAIENGEYDTSSSGRGVMKGPIKVTIQGHEIDDPLALPLFRMYTATMDITADSGELNFVIPADTAIPRGKKKKNL